MDSSNIKSQELMNTESETLGHETSQILDWVGAYAFDVLSLDTALRKANNT